MLLIFSAPEKFLSSSATTCPTEPTLLTLNSSTTSHVHLLAIICQLQKFSSAFGIPHRWRPKGQVLLNLPEPHWGYDHQHAPPAPNLSAIPHWSKSTVYIMLSRVDSVKPLINLGRNKIYQLEYFTEIIGQLDYMSCIITNWPKLGPK